MIDQEALSPEKRAQILHGAAVVFERDGYEGASMSQIAREANVSKGTLYNHFQSKADLFRAHMEQAFSLNFRQVFAELNEADGTEETLRLIGRRMVAMLMTPATRSLYRMAISEAESFPELALAFYESGPCTSVRNLSAWIMTQVARGRLRVEDSDFAAEQFFALCQTRLAMRYRLHLMSEPAEEAVARVVASAVEMFLACYGTRA